MKIDLGCGPNKKEGFVGIDIYPMAGVDAVADLRQKHWNFGAYAEVGDVDCELRTVSGVSVWMLPDNSVDEAHCSHFLEHLTNLGDKWERVNFLNELYRVLKPGAKCALIMPHWSSNRWYGDPTHKEPWSEMAFYYLSRAWRQQQAPHSDSEWNKEGGYSCDFECTWGYNLHHLVTTRNPEYQQHALAFYKEAAQDIVATLTKR